MGICAICRFPAVPDDVVLHGPKGRCVCLRCYLRETGGLRPVPAPLRRQVEAVLAAEAERYEAAMNAWWP